MLDALLELLDASLALLELSASRQSPPSKAHAFELQASWQTPSPELVKQASGQLSQAPRSQLHASVWHSSSQTSLVRSSGVHPGAHRLPSAQSPLSHSHAS